MNHKIKQTFVKNVREFAAALNDADTEFKSNLKKVHHF